MDMKDNAKSAATEHHDHHGRNRGYFDALINNQYDGLVQLKPISVPNTWLGDGNGEADFPLTNAPTKWYLRRFTYTVSHGDDHNTQVGYNVFGTGGGHEKMCWSAQGGGYSILKHWNWDHTQDGTDLNGTQDWENFTFEAVNEAEQLVVIRNTFYAIVVHQNGGFDGDPASYIGLSGNNFMCNARKANAIVLQVLFG
jgi:hypothetical protein